MVNERVEQREVPLVDKFFLHLFNKLTGLGVGAVRNDGLYTFLCVLDIFVGFFGVGFALGDGAFLVFGLVLGTEVGLLAFLFFIIATDEVEFLNQSFLFIFFLLKALARLFFTYISVVKNVLHHLIFSLVAVFEVLLTFLVLTGLLVFFLLGFYGPTTLGHGLRDLLA